VKKVPHRYNYPFEVYFEGKNSPWTLRARTGVSKIVRVYVH
jgi:hypothetical protein